MQRACTCAFKRALSTASPDVLAHRAVSSRASSTPITSSRFRRRSFSTVQACQYPRQATPFSSFKITDQSGVSDAATVEEAPSSSASSAEVNEQASNSSKSAPSTAWYLSEAPTSSTSTSTSSPSSTSSKKAPKPIPTPPAALPNYLRPLWDRLYESPFLDQYTINFIDSNAVQENVSEHNMDASVSSWVDWVVVASLRRGRERGIRGASEGAKIAMKECLKLFDEQLAAAERASNIASNIPLSLQSKRKNKIPKVLVEGLEIREPQWCLIDGGKAVIHIMTSNARKTWQVEGVASGFAEVRRDAERIGEIEEDIEEEEEEEYDEDVHASEVEKEIEAFDRDMSNSENKPGEFQPRM